jgi:L-gulono-1,4-lactone dehydrogenase
MAERWTNWAGEQVCAPERIARPASTEELAEIVRGAERVRVAGSGHSFTDIACTDGALVDLSRMDRVLAQDGDLVQVQAGITLHELGSELAARGLAMENQGDIDSQTLAGALATATHGTGARFGNLSSRVAAVGLVTAGGERVEIDGGDDLLAARVSLGCLGAIATVTLRCVPRFTLRRVDEPRSLAETLDRFDELAESNDHFEFFAFPYSDLAIVRLSERGDFAPEPPGQVERLLQDVLLENVVPGMLFRLGRGFPALIPLLNRNVARLIGTTIRTDYSHRVYASRRDVKFTEMEYAVPREHGAEAARRVLELVERRQLAVGFPIEVRVVAGDDALLSTAHGRDTAYVAVHQYRGMEFETYFRAVERIMDDYGGRPHWGKRHYQVAATLRPRYPEWERFQAVRARLDPEGKFGNDYSERVLGAVTSEVTVGG